MTKKIEVNKTTPRLRNKRTKKDKIQAYEVYTVTDVHGSIVYIGSGRCGRHEHCTSGTSHVYELNRMHFNNEQIEVQVVLVSFNKQETLDIEKSMILNYRPEFNKVWLDGSKDRNVLGMQWSCIQKNIFRWIDKQTIVSRAVKNRVSDQINILLDTYPISKLEGGVLFSDIKGLYKYTDPWRKSGKYLLLNKIFKNEGRRLKFNPEFLREMMAICSATYRNEKENDV